MFFASKLFRLTLWATSLGCAPVVQAGLSNVPAPDPTRIADSRVHDVIANGPDSCGRRYAPGPGPLRNQIPPCESLPAKWSSNFVVPTTSTNEATVFRWVEHYYVDWPCRPPSAASTGGDLIALPANDSGSSSCHAR